jgi:hypothetical protein
MNPHYHMTFCNEITIKLIVCRSYVFKSTFTKTSCLPSHLPLAGVKSMIPHLIQAIEHIEINITPTACKSSVYNSTLTSSWKAVLHRHYHHTYRLQELCLYDSTFCHQLSCIAITITPTTCKSYVYAFTFTRNHFHYPSCIAIAFTPTTCKSYVFYSTLTTNHFL